MKHRFAVFTAAAGLTAVLAFAQTASTPGHPGRQALMRHGFARLAQHLGLNDAQKENARAAFEQARKSAEPIAAQLRQNREALAEAVKTGQPEAELVRLSATTGALVGQLTAIHTQAMSKVYATLTPEQKEKAAQLHEQIRSRFEQRFRGRRPNG